MNLQSTIEFLQRIYDDPSNKNLTRLEHEAIGEALRRLRNLPHEPHGDQPARKAHLVVLRGRSKNDKE